ncbi:MAG: glycoside hydrolase family 2, partial [Prevotella sp.]|nr:glycoside hydrolase family 2 [Prevotella sp.]
FTVVVECDIIGYASMNSNLISVEWGSAPVLIRATQKAGKIKVKAEVQFPGIHAPTPAELELESVPYNIPMCYMPSETSTYKKAGAAGTTATTTLSEAEKAKMLQEVEAQQADFGLQK